jgi:hypothetical protein
MPLIGAPDDVTAMFRKYLSDAKDLGDYFRALRIIMDNDLRSPGMEGRSMRSNPAGRGGYAGSPES